MCWLNFFAGRLSLRAPQPEWLWWYGCSSAWLDALGHPGLIIGSGCWSSSDCSFRAFRPPTGVRSATGHKSRRPGSRPHNWQNNPRRQAHARLFLRRQPGRPTRQQRTSNGFGASAIRSPPRHNSALARSRRNSPKASASVRTAPTSGCLPILRESSAKCKDTLKTCAMRRYYHRAYSLQKRQQGFGQPFITLSFQSTGS